MFCWMYSYPWIRWCIPVVVIVVFLNYRYMSRHKQQIQTWIYSLFLTEKFISLDRVWTLISRYQCATLLPNVLLNMIKLMWHSHCSLKTALQLLGLQIEVSNLHNSRGIQIPAKVWYSDVHIHNLRMYITKIWNLRFELIACVYKVSKLNNSTFAFSKVWCSDMGSIQ